MRQNSVLRNNRDNGFTIFEILIALFLITMIFISVPSTRTGQRKDLETAADDIDRAIRFAGNESVLRNSLTRLTFNLNEVPISYAVEASQDTDVLLPSDDERSVKSLKDEQDKQKELEALNSKFQKVPEFEKMKRELKETISIIGVYNTIDDKPILEGQVSIYFYPSGERDGALIFFSSQDEIAALDILPYQNKTYITFQPYGDTSTVTPEQQQSNIMNEMYAEWIRK